MTEKSKLYTKTGDAGETSLVCGKRVSKGDDQLFLYGEVDELNSWIGLLLTKVKRKEERELLTKVQHQLFNLGSQLACTAKSREKYQLPELSQDVLDQLEKGIDRLDSELPKLKNFILPGGHKGSAYAHLCRTVARRVERQVVRWGREGNQLPNLAVQLLNRLSDYFFVLGRIQNLDKGVDDIVWKP